MGDYEVGDDQGMFDIIILPLNLLIHQLKHLSQKLMYQSN